MIEATLQLLGELGYGSLSLEMVARRAHASRPSIYRRWPTKAALVVDALIVVAGTDPAPDTGSLYRDLLSVAASMATLYASPLAHKVVPSLLGDLTNHPELAERFRERYIAPRRASVQRALTRGVARGEIPPVEDPELICDLVAGPLFHSAFLLGRDLDEAYAIATVDAVMTVLGAHHLSPHDDQHSNPQREGS